MCGVSLLVIPVLGLLCAHSHCQHCDLTGADRCQSDRLADQCMFQRGGCRAIVVTSVQALLFVMQLAARDHPALLTSNQPCLVAELHRF